MNDFFMGLLDEANPEQLFKLIEVMLESNQAILERNPVYPNQFSVQLSTQQLVLKSSEKDIVIDRIALENNDFIKRLAHYLPPVPNTESKGDAAPGKSWLVDLDLNAAVDHLHKTSSEAMLAYLIKIIKSKELTPIQLA